MEAAATALSHAAAVENFSVDELNAQTDSFLRALKDVHAALRSEIGCHSERTNELTVYQSREALQLTGLRAAVVGGHVDALLAALADRPGSKEDGEPG